MQNKDNVYVIDNYDLPLKFYYKSCQYIIGCDTTAILEGMVEGQIPLIYMDNNGWYEQMKFVYENNGYLISSAHEIINITNLNNHSIPSINEYYKDFQIDRFQSFFSDLIKSSKSNLVQA